MERTARCLCGELKIRVEGDPKLSLACNCLNCQRRTGSAFAVSAYFANEAVIEMSGNPKKFHGKSDDGNNATTAFCGNCGSTVYWSADIFTGLVGIAVGCFSDPNFPEPSAAVWNRSKHSWVMFPDHWHKMEKQEPKDA